MNLLMMRSLTKTYAVTLPVEMLHDLNPGVKTREKVLIVGYSRAGKSTLPNILGLPDEPDDGGYLLEDEHAGHLPEVRRNLIRARKIGFVSQDLHVLGHRSVTENLELKLSTNHVPHTRREAMIASALEAMELSGRTEALTRLSSGGEKQRLAFTRTMICDPQLILADKPTGNLDQKSAVTILELLDTQAEKDVTVVIISHNERLWDWADRVLRLGSEVLHED